MLLDLGDSWTAATGSPKGGHCGGDQVDGHILALGCDNEAVQGPNDKSSGRGARSAPAGRQAAAEGAKKATAKKATAAKAPGAATKSSTAKIPSANVAAPVPRRTPNPAGVPAGPRSIPRARSDGATGRGADRRVPRQGAAGPRRPLTPPGQVPRRIPRPQVSELDRSYIRGLRRAIVFLLVLGLCGFLLDGANRPADPRLVPAADPGAAKGSPAFGSATLTVTSSRHKDACVLEAVTPAQQQAGLQRRTTVAPYAGMAFVFSQLSNEHFWMKDTLIPLSVAFFDAGGKYETAATMPPCPPTTKVCPTYQASEPYEVAIEVPAGQLKGMGIGPGSTISLGGACTT